MAKAGRIGTFAIACAWLCAPLATMTSLPTMAAEAAPKSLASRGEQSSALPTTLTITDDRQRTVTLPAPAQRIVSLLPSLTETVCALQACDRLVGVDRWSDWPAEVRALPRLGGMDDVEVERVVRLRPDLVLAATSTRAIGRLEALGLKVVALEPQTHADVRRSLGVVAALLGRPAAGSQVWAGIEADLQAAAARVPTARRGQTAYVEVGSEPYAAGPASFVGQTITRLGLGHVVPAALGAFPRLNPEFVVRAQPALIIAPARALDEMPARPGWSRLQALQRGSTCGFDEARWNLLVRPGPRLGEGAQAVADCLAGK